MTKMTKGEFEELSKQYEADDDPDDLGVVPAAEWPPEAEVDEENN